MNEWQFNLDDGVDIIASNEHGVVIGRAEYLHAEPSYLVRYVAGDGRATEEWWTERALALSGA